MKYQNNQARSSSTESHVPLPPKVIRREGNRLMNQKSLYLRQHAHNPVDWYPWGKEALERARLEDKPIFVSIGYSSCHWCHVMEREVFEDESVAGFINTHFICIKVDREERPDLDKVFMDAVLAMTGNGGWPMSVFLTPAQKPFFGGTYLPRAQFVALISRIDEIFTSNRSQIESQAQTVFAHISRELETKPGSMDDQAFNKVISTAKHDSDREWGGFRNRMKFPMPTTWSFLLHYYRKSPDDELAAALRTTLDQMGSGGIQDHIGGGFHRYTTERTWLVPHFEKMLYDNALIANLYIEAAAVFGESRYTQIARQTLNFMIREMSGPEGGFFASFDADSGGSEGSFYLWTPEEITAVVGKRDGPVISALLGITSDGNFEGKSILTRRTDPAGLSVKFGRERAEIAGLFDKYRPLLRKARSKRTPPGLDRKVITSWNGLVISSLARGYSLFGEKSYRQAAEKTADFLMTTHHTEAGALLRSSYDGAAEHDGILDDYAFLAVGLFDLYQATGELKQLERALGLIEYAEQNFRHPNAAFYLTGKGQDAPLGRQMKITDGVIPSGNSAMLQALLVAAALTGNDNYRKQVESDIDAYATLMRGAGLEMAGWFDAALKYRGPFYEVVVCGDPLASATKEMLAEFHRRMPSYAVLTLLPADGPSPEAVKIMPAVVGKRATGGKPTAYVCRLGACKKPTHDPATLARQISDGLVNQLTVEREKERMSDKSIPEDIN